MIYLIKIFIGILFLTTISHAAFSQTVKLSDSATIKGKITNEKGVEIEVALVLLKDSKIYTFTEADGSFSIEIPLAFFEKEVGLIFASYARGPKEIAIQPTTKFLEVQLEMKKRDSRADERHCWPTGLPYGENQATSRADSLRHVAAEKKRFLQRWIQYLLDEQNRKVYSRKKQETLSNKNKQ